MRHGCVSMRMLRLQRSRMAAPQIKKALQQCANQLSKKLAKRQARAPRCAACASHAALNTACHAAQLAKARKARKKALARYIPDVARAVFSVLSKARPSRRCWLDRRGA